MLKTKERTVTSSLNVHLINSMVIFTLVIIASFTAIQVYGQLSRATDQNLYRSKLASIIIHQNIGQIVDQVNISEIKKASMVKDLQSTITGLVASDVVKEIFIVNKKGDIIAQSSAAKTPVTPSIQDMERIQNIIDLNAHDNWSYPFIDRDKNTLDTLMPITLDGKVAYVLRTSYSLGNLKDALRAVYVPIIITALLIIVLSVTNTLSISKKIVRPIRALNEASKQIAKGNLELQVNITTNDEIEELSQTYNHMTLQLARMKEIAEDANPLTKLPGNNVIREEIDRRIREDKKFIVIHCDLDNFKVFNDTYGIGAGDVAIRMTAAAFKDAVEKFGGSDEFIGHEGGDDFVLLSTPQQVKPLTDFFLAEFDKRSKLLYSKEDQERGYILGKERRGKGSEAKEKPEVLAKFPLMSISLSGLSNEEHPFESYADITNRIVDVKKQAKNIIGSCLLIVK